MERLTSYSSLAMMSDCVANTMDECLGRCRFVGVLRSEDAAVRWRWCAAPRDKAVELRRGNV